MTRARNTSARILAPSMALSSCVRAYVMRSTVGAPLSDAERISHFPVNPTCTLTWFTHGQLDEWHIEGQRDRVAISSRAVCSGPFTVPSATFSRAPVEAVMCMLMPEAFHALTGLEPSAWVNRIVPLEQVLGAQWESLTRAVFAATDIHQRIAAIEAFIAPRWRQVRNSMPGGARSYVDWVGALATHAATSDLGRGARQIERRVKRWTGLPLRELRFIANAEALFLRTRAADASGRMAWGELASEAGFADQSHMCRASRRASGLSPAELRRRVESDESFWIYRIWG